MLRKTITKQSTDLMNKNITTNCLNIQNANQIRNGIKKQNMVMDTWQINTFYIVLKMSILPYVLSFRMLHKPLQPQAELYCSSKALITFKTSERPATTTIDSLEMADLHFTHA